MTAHVNHLEMSGLRLPATTRDLRRDRIGRKKFHDGAYDEGYDTDTLVYDCFFDPVTETVKLICPPLLNFAPILEEAQFHVDGRAVSIAQIMQLTRGTVISLESGDGQVLSISHRLFGGNLVIGRSFVADLAGMNGVYTISRNNRLEWIIDWLRYYVDVHGLQAVVLSDNGSTDYTPQQLGDAIAGVAGLQQAYILHARYPFGPVGGAFKALFLQMTLGEMVRTRFFAKARAVLNADIDELFYSRSGQSVFDATVQSPMGYLRADARWVYAPQIAGDVPRFRDHSAVSATGVPKANRKWCIDPQGPLQGREWLTHFINTRQDPVNPDFCMWHFHQISTHWKAERGTEMPTVVPYPELIETMKHVFC